MYLYVIYICMYIHIYIYIPPLTVSDVRITKASSTSFRWVSGLGFRI